jgi:hypothetical protein
LLNAALSRGPLLLCCRAQAAVGNLLASLIPRQQMVPAVKPENLHPDPEVVRQQLLGCCNQLWCGVFYFSGDLC